MDAEDEEMPPELVEVEDETEVAKGASEKSDLAEKFFEGAPITCEKKGAEESQSSSSGGHTVPVTIVTGWLGSGKTTFLRHVLETLQKSHKKIAIIQNEASGVGVEDELKLVDDEGRPVADLKEIGGGCVCCSVRSDFVAALEALLKTRKFDHIFVECSGIADPGQLAQMFWLDDSLEGGIHLNGVIGVIDARLTNLSGMDKVAKATRNQLAYADIILMNKIDLVDENTIKKLKSTLRQLNPVPVELTIRSKVKDLQTLLNLQAYKPDAAEAAIQQALGPTSHSHESHGHGHASAETHLCHHPRHSGKCAHGCNDNSEAKHGTNKLSEKECVHDESIGAHFVELKEVEIDLEKLRRWLATVLWAHIKVKENEGQKEKKMNDASVIMRMKGLLRVKGSTERHYLQAVQELFEITTGPKWSQQDEAVSSKFVIIGQRLNAKELEDGLRNCCSGAD